MAAEIIPFSHDRLAELEAALAATKLDCNRATTALVKVWDRKDAGESVGREEDVARARVARCNDAKDDAHRAFIAEWQRVGSPLAWQQR
jgi:hypothetical protein